MLATPARRWESRGRRAVVGPRRTRAELLSVLLVVVVVQVLAWGLGATTRSHVAILLVSVVAAPALLVLARGRVRD